MPLLDHNAGLPPAQRHAVGFRQRSGESDGMDGRERAAGLVRATLSLADGGLRAAYVVSVVRAWDPAVLARALDAVCERAEQAETAAREALLAIVDALNGEGMEEVVQRLREEAAQESLLALDRLIRYPSRSLRPGARDGGSAMNKAEQNPRVPDD